MSTSEIRNLRANVAKQDPVSQKSRTNFVKKPGPLTIKRAHKSLFSSGALMKVQKLFKPYTELRM